MAITDMDGCIKTSGGDFHGEVQALIDGDMSIDEAVDHIADEIEEGLAALDTTDMSAGEIVEMFVTEDYGRASEAKSRVAHVIANGGTPDDDEKPVEWVYDVYEDYASHLNAAEHKELLSKLEAKAQELVDARPAASAEPE